MARCRNLKPGFFTNELLAEMPPLTRLLFAGLWCHADREGRLEDRPKKLKLQILPCDDFDVDEALTQLSRGDDPFIVRYQVEGVRYIQIVKFSVNQSPHNTEKESEIPEPPLSNCECTVRQQLPCIGSEVTSSEVLRKGNAKGKPKRRQISAADVPVPEGFEIPEVRSAIGDWLEYKTRLGTAYKDASYLGRKVAEFTRAGPAAFVAAVNSSIGNNYQGIYPAKDQHGNRSPRQPTAGDQYDPSTATAPVKGW